MKKIVLTFAIVLGITFGAYAQGGLFQYGTVPDEEYYGAYRGTSQPLLPAGHSMDEDIDSQTGQPAPLGGGLVLLMGFGAAYLMGKKPKEK